MHVFNSHEIVDGTPTGVPVINDSTRDLAPN